MSELKIDACKTYSPVIKYRDGFSPRNLRLPYGELQMYFYHDYYWALLDQMEEDSPGVTEGIIEIAFGHALLLTEDHDISWAYHIFNWTFPFEVALHKAVYDAQDYNAANDFVSGVYSSFELLINNYNWPTPLTYRRIKSWHNIHDVIMG